MVTLAVVVAVSGGDRPVDAKRAGQAIAAAAAARPAEVLLVVAPGSPLLGSGNEATTIVDEASDPSEATALRAAVDYAQRLGAEDLLVALPVSIGRTADDGDAWRRLAAAAPGRIVAATSSGLPVGLVRLPDTSWPLLPFDGGVSRLLTSRPELVTELDLASGPNEAPPPVRADEADIAAVGALLGRPPAGGFTVAVRDRDGAPVVICNAPFLDDGTPMPTRYWLVGRREQELVGRLESAGGVRRAEEELPAEEVAAAHARYAESRDAAIPAGHSGPRPSGGVGGTRTGVKCLHAHLAWYLAGGGDPVGRWVARQLSAELDGPVAAIDCGTNSTRLLVLGRDGRQLERRMIVTRLGEGVDRTGELLPGAIERTIAALAEYRQSLDALGVVRVRATATSAARDASNAEEFFSAAEKVLGVRPELIEGEEEGRLSYRGATAALDPAAGPYLVIDLGGGSTEFVAGSPEGPSAAPAAIVSLPMGCVRVTERFLTDDPPTSDEVSAARAYVRETLESALGRQPALREPEAMVGVAGTISTLVALELGLDSYDPAKVHLARLSKPAVERWLQVLSGEDVTARRCRGAVEPGRADVIVGGAAVLAESMAVLGFDELVHSEADILDGIAAELLS